MSEKYCDSLPNCKLSSNFDEISYVLRSLADVHILRHYVPLRQRVFFPHAWLLDQGTCVYHSLNTCSIYKKKSLFVYTHILYYKTLIHKNIYRRYYCKFMPSISRRYLPRQKHLQLINQTVKIYLHCAISLVFVMLVVTITIKKKAYTFSVNFLIRITRYFTHCKMYIICNRWRDTKTRKEWKKTPIYTNKQEKYTKIKEKNSNILK